MASTPYSVRLPDVLPLPAQFDGLVTEISDIVSRVGLLGATLVLNPPVLPPGPSAVDPAITEAEAFDLLEYFDEEAETSPPAPPDVSTVVPAPPLDQGSRVLTMDLKALSDIVLELPGLDGVHLVINPGIFQALLTLSATEFSIRVTVGAAIRFAPSVLQALRRVTAPDGRVTFEPDPITPYVQIELATVTVSVGSAGNIDVTGGIGIRLDSPVGIGSTGIVIESADVALSLSGNGPRPVGTPSGWKGFLIESASLRIPSVFSGAFTATGLGIGSGGVSGTIGTGPFALDYDPKSATLTGDLVGTVLGIHGGLTALSLSLQQNIPSGGSISAKLVLPFFEADQPLDVDISLAVNGAFMVAVRSGDGLLRLRKAGLFDIAVESIRFDMDDRGLSRLVLSGKITPLVPGVKWPGVDVRELSIDSHGNVHIDGGWLTLPKQVTLPFHGFPLEITQIGFGKLDDGGKWIGFSGKVKLPGEMPAGGSVEGLRVIWYPDGHTRVTFEGISVDFSIKNKLTFHGHVAYRELPGDVHQFVGDIKAELTALDLELDANLVIGTRAGAPYFALDFELAIPAGYPLFSTGASLYEMAGLLALQMGPAKTPEEEWYEGWYKRGTEGVTDFDKWKMQDGAKAFGAGATIGTADNGFTFAAKALLVLVFPGPVLLIEGKGNLLQERASLRDDPRFRALAVLDNDAGTLLIGLDAVYQYGELLDIRGGAEAFFDFHNAGNWHINVGVDRPRERRIHATIFKLFDANAYLMISPSALATGAWIGFQRHYGFKALKIDFEAWIEGNARLSWRPAYFHGDLRLHGSARLRIFGIKLGMTLDASLAADVFDPYEITGHFAVSIDLPWPLSDFEADITLKWGPKPGRPAIPKVLEKVTIEHFKVTASWPPALAGDLSAPPAGTSVVPVDCRPRVTFARPVSDDAGIGGNSQPAVWEQIGDPSKGEGPARVQYSLQRIAMQKWSTGSWKDVPRPLWGSWAPEPHLPVGDAPGAAPGVAQTKLWLWSRTPFDYTSRSGSGWDDWFLSTHPDYPCMTEPAERSACCDFSLQVVGTAMQVVPCGEEIITFEEPGRVAALDAPILGFSRALRFQDESSPPLPTAPQTVTFRFGIGGAWYHVRLFLSEPAASVRLLMAGEHEADQHVHDFRQHFQPIADNPLAEGGTIFTVFNAQGTHEESIRFVPVSTAAYGLVCESHLNIDLPCTANSAEATLILSVPGAQASTRGRFTEWSVTLTAFRPDGSVVDQSGAAGSEEQVTLTVHGVGIVRLSITSGAPLTALLALHFSCARGLVSATAFDSAQQVVARGTADDHVIVLNGKDIASVLVERDSPLYFVEICITLPPSRDEVTKRGALAQRMKDALVHWSEGGEVLEPFSDYRLAIDTQSYAVFADGTSDKRPYTEYAYFRTDGPPGLAKEATPLGTLDLYVRQTTPPTIAIPPATEALTRPVYRAYDVGVEFNEDYVDLMYRLAGRELEIHLFDANDRPLTDATGSPVIRRPTWGHTETLTPSESERRWTETINRNRCSLGSIETKDIPHDGTLEQPSAGLILDADTLYEARLIPSGAGAVPAYRFRFLTSRYTNFFHHLHSFNDETWAVALTLSPEAAALVAQAVTLPAAATEAEARPYAALAAAVLGPDAERKTGGVEIERLVTVEGTVFLHVRTGEPIDWTRTDVAFFHGPADMPPPSVPGAVKITGATFGGTESVALLLRETTDLSGWKILWKADGGWQTWLELGANERFGAGTQLQRTVGARSSGFGGQAVDLMLVAADGTTSHARHVAPETDYALVGGARILRRRDGTAFFLFPAGVRPLVDGSYRLRFTFRRDNRTAEPQSAVYSENGDRTPEVVSLDFTVPIPRRRRPGL